MATNEVDVLEIAERVQSVRRHVFELVCSLALIAEMLQEIDRGCARAVESDRKALPRKRATRKAAAGVPPQL